MCINEYVNEQCLQARAIVHIENDTLMDLRGYFLIKIQYSLIVFFI